MARRPQYRKFNGVLVGIDTELPGASREIPTGTPNKIIVKNPLTPTYTYDKSTGKSNAARVSKAANSIKLNSNAPKAKLSSDIPVADLPGNRKKQIKPVISPDVSVSSDKRPISWNIVPVGGDDGMDPKNPDMDVDPKTGESVLPPEEGTSGATLKQRHYDVPNNIRNYFRRRS